MQVAGLREENAALRSESRMVMEQASVLFQEAQALHAMHRNLATSSQRVGLGLRSLHNMLLEKERARPQVPVRGSTPVCCTLDCSLYFFSLVGRGIFLRMANTHLR